MHRHWSRASLVITRVEVWGRRLGNLQRAVLKALLERGTYPGTWTVRNAATTIRVLRGLEKRALVVTEVTDRTDVRGEPDPAGRKVVFYRPALWLRNAMDAPTDSDALNILSDALPSSGIQPVGKPLNRKEH